MTSRESAAAEITPEVLLRAYACGIFPMAESADDPSLFWVEPEMRGVIPLDGFRITSRLARTVRSDGFTVTSNTAFKAVMSGKQVAVLVPTTVLAEQHLRRLDPVARPALDPLRRGRRGAGEGGHGHGQQLPAAGDGHLGHVASLHRRPNSSGTDG